VSDGMRWAADAQRQRENQIGTLETKGASECFVNDVGGRRIQQRHNSDGDNEQHRGPDCSYVAGRQCGLIPNLKRKEPVTTGFPNTKSHSRPQKNCYPYERDLPRTEESNQVSELRPIRPEPKHRERAPGIGEPAVL
jgi:hypothetical protein